MQSTALKASAVCLLGIATWQISDAAIIKGKAWLAQYLLQDAWQKTLKTQQTIKPWPWADHWPVARLQIPAHEQDLIVLAGAAGNSLAFAPGHMTQTALPGSKGLSVISAHRDTHFTFLRHLNQSDEIIVTDMHGKKVIYQIDETGIVDSRHFNVNDVTQSLVDNDSLLMLSTCYPFDEIVPGGSLRYIVMATQRKTVYL